MDIDGKNKIYDPIFVDCEGNSSQLITYPNPSKYGFNIAISDSKLVGELVLIMRDAMGKVIIEKSISVEEGINLYPIFSTELENGIYFTNCDDVCNDLKGKNFNCFLTVLRCSFILRFLTHS